MSNIRNLEMRCFCRRIHVRPHKFLPWSRTAMDDSYDALIPLPLNSGESAMDKYLQKELDILLEEYKALRGELVLTMGNTRQILHLSLIAIGVFLAASPNIITSGYTVLFLIIPFCLYGLGLTFLRYLFLHIEIIDHIHHVVTPRVRSILKDLCPNKDRNFDGVMSWEEESGFVGPLKRYSVIYWPIPAAPQLVPILASVVSIAAYFFTVHSPLKSLPAVDYFLLVANIFALPYLMYIGFRVGRRTVRTSDISERATQRTAPVALDNDE